MATERPAPDARARRSAHLRAYFKRYRWLFVGGGVALLLTNLLGIAIPRQLGRAVALMREASESSAPLAAEGPLRTVALTIIALAIGAGIARVASRIWIFNAGRDIEFDLRNEVFARLTQLDASYYDATTTGDITSRVTNDVSYVRLLYAISFLHMVNTSLAYTMALSQMVTIDLKLTLWCLAPYPAMLFALRFIVRALFTQTKIVQGQLADMSSLVQENLSGMPVIKSFNLQGREIASFSKSSRDFFDESLKLAIYRGLLTAMMATFAGVGTLTVLWAGASRIEAGDLSVAQFVEFNGYVVSLAFPTAALGWVFAVWHRGLAAFDRVLEVLDAPTAITSPANPQPMPPREGAQARGELVLEHVTFGYDPERPVLHDLNITIPAGGRVALVGKTGSGKTALLRLLTRYADPQQGTIRLDGVALDALELRALRSELGMVPQDPFLFSMSVGQNLRFGLDALLEDPTLERDAPTRSLLHPDGPPISQQARMQEAIEAAALVNDLAQLPQGLDTLVGERGVTLSGGQKQRVTLARALLMDPRVLILDDALSSVDAQTEQQILDHLDTIMAGRTCILSTHRYNALKRVDLILVLDEGRIVERGDHEALMARGGLYAKMVAQQRLREQLEAS